MTKTEERCRKALLIIELIKEYANPVRISILNNYILLNYDVVFLKNVCEFFGMKVGQLNNFRKEGKIKEFKFKRK